MRGGRARRHLRRLPAPRRPTTPVRPSPATPSAWPSAGGGCTTAALPARETSSTAEACRLVAEGDEPGLVAVASPTAAARWGLEAIAEGVEDFPGAETRFVVVGRRPPPPTGADRTMFVLVPPNDQAGVLLRALEHLSGRGLNLSAIASRPLRVRLGEYCFVLVVDAHLDDAPVAGAFDALRDDGYSIKVLGATRSGTAR